MKSILVFILFGVVLSAEEKKPVDVKPPDLDSATQLALIGAENSIHQAEAAYNAKMTEVMEPLKAKIYMAQGVAQSIMQDAFKKCNAKGGDFVLNFVPGKVECIHRPPQEQQQQRAIPPTRGASPPVAAPAPATPPVKEDNPK